MQWSSWNRNGSWGQGWQNSRGSPPTKPRTTKRETKAEQREAEVQATLARLRGQAPAQDTATRGRAPPQRQEATPEAGLTPEQQQRSAKMRKVGLMIKALTNLKAADEDGELGWIDNKLEELRCRAKGADPPHVRMQNAERRLAEAQCKRERAERHLAEAQVSAEGAVAEYEAALSEYEEERAQQARCSPVPPSVLSSLAYKDLFSTTCPTSAPQRR